MLGDRRLSLCRELTKLNEEVIRTTVSGAMKYYEEKAPRGEYVLILEGASEDEVREEAFWSDMSMEEHTEHYVSLGMTKKDAIKAVASDRGLAKSEVYSEVMKK